MPSRKKATETSTESTTPTRRRRRASELLAEAVEPASPESTTPEVAATEPEPEAKPRRRRKAPPIEEVVATEPEPTAAPEPVHTPEPPKPERRRRKAPPVPEVVVTLESTPEPEPQEDLGEGMPAFSFRARGTTSPPAPTAEAQSEPEVATEVVADEDDGLPRFQTRKSEKGRRRTKPEPQAEQEAAPDSGPELEDGVPSVAFRGQEDPTPAIRKSESRRGRDRKPKPEPQPEPEPEPVAVEPVAKPEAKKPRREPIPAPPDAPRVALIQGSPTPVRAGKAYTPMAFFAGAPTEAQLPHVLDEVRMAVESGVPFIALRADLEADAGSARPTAEAFVRMAEKVLAAGPDAQLLVRVCLLAPTGWDKRWPSARGTSNRAPNANPSLSDDGYWKEAEAALVGFIERIHGSLEDRLFGVHLDQNEWVNPAENGYDTSPAAVERFQEWLRLRYRNEVVSLRAAWFDGSISFETARVPDHRARASSGEFVRTSRKSRPWVDYHLFLSDATVQRIDDLARAAKVAAGGALVVGCSYGYTFEWSHPASGHLSLGKLLVSPYVDYVSGPPSYRSREPGGVAAPPLPLDSCALNGKLYISEEDFRTPISGRQEPETGNPLMKTPQALESAHWRGAGSALAHRSGVSWMDLYANGWLNSPGIWRRARSVVDVLTRRLGAPQEAPDVALFVDERSLAYLADPTAFEVLVQNVRESVLRSGLSVGLYLLSDLAHRERFPESKLYVFVNAWDLRPEVRHAIKTRLQCDGKVLFWLYAAGLFEGGRESLERVREVTGIALKPQPFNSKSGTTLLNHRDPLCLALPERELAKGGSLGQSYFAIPEEGTVLGEYTQTGLPSFVVRHMRNEGQHWTSVFLGEPIVTPGLFRALGQMAGAHVWSFNNDLVHVRPPFLTVHCGGSGQRTITLKDKWVAYNLLARDWAPLDGNCMRFMPMDGMTTNFLVGTRGDVETVLGLDLDELTKVEVAESQENTVRWDSVMFDVPIVQLDEWVEETWSEELADDLLLKPSLIDNDLASEPDTTQAAEDEDERGRRKRRRRRRGRGDDGPEPPRAPRTQQPSSTVEAGIHAMFRKRE